MCSQIVANANGITFIAAARLSLTIWTPAPSSASFQPNNINSGNLNHLAGLMITSLIGVKLTKSCAPFGMKSKMIENK